MNVTPVYMRPVSGRWSSSWRTWSAAIRDRYDQTEGDGELSYFRGGPLSKAGSRREPVAAFVQFVCLGRTATLFEPVKM